MEYWNKNLVTAAAKGINKSVEECLKNAADVNCRNIEGRTPLHWAAGRGHTDTVELLISKGALIENKMKNGDTPLHRAALRGYADTVYLLISEGAVIDSKNNNGDTPLHMAASEGNRETIYLLISMGAVIDSTNKYGETPYDCGDENIGTLIKNIKKEREQVLKEIRGLGMETADDFQEVLKTGTYKCFWNRIYLVGPYSVGKSTLARILVGEPKSTKRKSTDGIWIYMGRAGMDVEQRKCKCAKGAAIKEIVAGLLMSVTMEYTRENNRDKRTKTTRQLEDAPTNSSQRAKLEDPPVTQQSAISSTDSRQKEKFEDAPATHNSAISPTDSSSLKEKFEDEQVTHHSEISPTESSQKEKLENAPETHQSEMHQIDMSQMKQCIDSSLTNHPEIPSNETGPVPCYEHTKDEKSIDKMHKLVIQAIKDGKYKQKIIPIDIWDFGGQKDYYMTHQLFITSRGIYVLMFNGSIDIHQIMDDLSFLPGHFGKPTVAVYLRHWVNSILTYCKRTDNGFPRIVFVATHKDKIESDDKVPCHTVTDKIEDQRKKLMKSIHELFKSHAGVKHLEFNPLIFINAKNKKDDEIKIIQRRLIARAVQHPRWGENMPTAWIPLELQLAEKIEEGTNVISREEIERLNSQNTHMVLEKKQLNTFLKVQHSLGKLLYFDENKLRDFIIINPAYMVNVLRSIVTEKQFWGKDEKYISVFKKLQEAGKICRDDIYLLWSQKHFHHILKYKEHMVGMLIHLDILVAPRATFVTASTTTPTDLSNDDFLVPCMINTSNTTNYIKESCIRNKTLILAYTFIDEIIPPALAYRFLGSFITMWEVKTYKGRNMLFSDLAVVEINENHDVAVQVQGNRIVVSLVHSKKLENIVPTLASSVQECLTASVHRISEFYSTLSNAGEKTVNTTMPFKIEFGVFCRKRFYQNWSLCFFSQKDSTESSWTCPVHDRQHDVHSMHLWFKEKVPLEECKNSCTGLGSLEREYAPSDMHLCRVAKMLDVQMCRQVVIHLGLTVKDWEQIEYQFQNQNPINLMFTALIRWKHGQSNPTFLLLQNAFNQCGGNVHILCQVFRDVTPDTPGLTEEALNKKPTYKALQSVLDHIGDNVMHLSVELGLFFTEIERIQYEYKNKLLDQARAVLKCWMGQSRERPTVRTLVKALHRIGKKSCIQQIKF